MQNEATTIVWGLGIHVEVTFCKSSSVIIAPMVRLRVELTLAAMSMLR